MDSLEQSNHLKDTDSGSSMMSAKDIENLEWALNFMKRFEKKRNDANK